MQGVVSLWDTLYMAGEISTIAERDIKYVTAIKSTGQHLLGRDIIT